MALRIKKQSAHYLDLRETKTQRVINQKRRKKNAVKKTASMMHCRDLACLRTGVKYFNKQIALRIVRGSLFSS